jgi:hypothetical protein
MLPQEEVGREWSCRLDREACGVRGYDFPCSQVRVADVPPVSPVPAAPTVGQLFALLDERDRVLGRPDRLISDR